MTRGSWWTAWLAGAGAPFALGMIALAVVFSANDYPDGPTRWEQSYWFLRDASGIAAVIALLSALLLIGAMALVERAQAKPLPVWLAAGLLASSPIALLVLAFAQMTQHGPMRPMPATTTAGMILFFYLCGAIGTLVAFRVRNRGWRK